MNYGDLSDEYLKSEAKFNGEKFEQGGKMYYNEAKMIDSLMERKAFLEKLLKDKKGKPKKDSLPKGTSVRVQRKGEFFYYYLREDKRDTTGRYLKKSEWGIAKNIIQKGYDEDVRKMISDELNCINQYLTHFNPSRISKEYEKLSEGRRRMVSPLDLSDEEYVKAWQSVEYEGKAEYEKNYDYFTDRGEQVRSKSEILIANLLNKYDIPYRYEYPIYVSGFGTVYPDFTALNVRERKEIYIEHLGLMDDADYRENALKKINQYEKAGIYIGDQLLITFETAQTPLNTVLVEQKIKKFLL